MCRDVKCGACEHEEDLGACASKHVEEARMLLSEGRVEEADGHLAGLESHLKE